MKRVVVVLVAVLAAERSAIADEPAKWRASAEADILGYPFGGYSIHVGVRPPMAPHLRLGFSVFGGDLPDWFVDIQNTANGSKTENQGFTVRADAVSLEGFYHLRPRGSSLFFGGYLAMQSWELRQRSTMSESTAKQVFVWPAAGYRLFPGQQQTVFVTAWAGLGVGLPSFLEKHSGPARFEEFRIYPFGSIHVGFEL